MVVAIVNHIILKTILESRWVSFAMSWRLINPNPFSNMSKRLTRKAKYTLGCFCRAGDAVATDNSQIFVGC